MTRRDHPSWLTHTPFAHRGLHSAGVPENSLAAAKAAIARGFGIECDIQRSADNRAIVFHDWELERLTGENGKVCDLTSEKFGSLRLAGSSETPVTLERFLDDVAGRAPLLIEIKSKPDYEIDPICSDVSFQLARRSGSFAVMSFDPRVPQWFALHAPNLPRGLVGTDSILEGFEGMWRDPDCLEKAAPDFLAIDLRDVDHPAATAWRGQGKPVLTWTVRSAEDRGKALNFADAIIAEEPGIYEL